MFLISLTADGKKLFHLDIKLLYRKEIISLTRKRFDKFYCVQFNFDFLSIQFHFLYISFFYHNDDEKNLLFDLMIFKYVQRLN